MVNSRLNAGNLERGQATLPNLQIAVGLLGFLHSLYPCYKLLRQRKDRFNIHRHILQTIQRPLHRRPDHRIFIKHCLRLLVRTFRLHCENFPRQLAYRVLNLHLIDTERPGLLIHFNSAFVG